MASTTSTPNAAPTIIPPTFPVELPKSATSAVGTRTLKIEGFPGGFFGTGRRRSKASSPRTSEPSSISRSRRKLWTIGRPAVRRLVPHGRLVPTKKAAAVAGPLAASRRAVRRLAGVGRRLKPVRAFDVARALAGRRRCPREIRLAAPSGEAGAPRRLAAAALPAARRAAPLVFYVRFEKQRAFEKALKQRAALSFSGTSW